jgi:hypothetical protein
VHSLELDHADDPFSIDLHTRLERWYFRGLRRDLGDQLFERTSPVRLANAGAGHPPLRGLAQPYLAAFLALHAGYVPGRLRLVALVELVLVLRGDVNAGALMWDELADLFRRTGTGRFVHPALALVEDLAPGTVEPGLLLDLERRATVRTQRVLDALRAGDFAPLTRPSLDAKLMWARGPRELLLNVSELVFPSDDGLSMGIARLQWRRLRALVSGRAGWRSDRRPDSSSP